MRRETENVVLLVVGISVAMVTVTGAYTRYVKPGMLPWLAISAAVLIGLALVAIVRDIRGGGAHEHGDLHAGHTHRNGVVWLLVVPVVLLIFVVPPPLSAKATPPATVNVTQAQTFPPLPAGQAPTVSLPEVLMRIAVGRVGGLDGHGLTITGFTMHDGDRVYLAKIVIFCCAADAQLARLQLSGPALPVAAGLPENTWVRVEGTVPPGQRYSGTDSIPRIDVSSVVRIDPPANTYGS
ncbi:TIGR03943 family protein [Mycobacterium sp. NBC_00419]|uniref:TIGR03943 family putative permease subunit n=1 Tax=Mycobacterium sp. NBC_00419 TaxID=2975989 RepID=UPI002E1DF5C5